jgi:hypothetical protein
MDIVLKVRTRMVVHQWGGIRMMFLGSLEITEQE